MHGPGMMAAWVHGRTTLAPFMLVEHLKATEDDRIGTKRVELVVQVLQPGSHRRVRARRRHGSRGRRIVAVRGDRQGLIRGGRTPRRLHGRVARQ